jgi:hypothetical protein
MRDAEGCLQLTGSPTGTQLLSSECRCRSIQNSGDATAYSMQACKQACARLPNRRQYSAAVDASACHCADAWAA